MDNSLNLNKKNTTSDLNSFENKLPWMRFNIGDRVVIRRREADGLYDSLGELLEKSAEYVVVKTRKGVVKIPAEKMVIGKVVDKSS